MVTRWPSWAAMVEPIQSRSGWAIGFGVAAWAGTARPRDAAPATAASVVAVLSRRRGDAAMGVSFKGGGIHEDWQHLDFDRF